MNLLKPNLWRGLRIGLLGGSFNPPHAGHVHISQVALRMLQLDCVWWLVSPQNPLKSAKGTPGIDVRMAWCADITHAHPHIVVSDLERQLGTHRTYDTLTRMRPYFPGASFVWVTGMDNAATFHRWHRWLGILDLIATAHIARPPAESMVRNSPLRMIGRQSHMVLNRSAKPDLKAGRTFWIPGTPLESNSSTLLRANGSNKMVFAQ